MRENDKAKKNIMELDDEVKEGVVKRFKRWQQGSEDPLAWVMELVEYLKSMSVGLPSPELGELLVSHICFENNHPSMWKFMDRALSSPLLFPLQVLSLLSSRVIPHRHSQPQAYALFLALLLQYAFSFDPSVPLSCRFKIINSVDIALQLSQTYKLHVLELGHVFVLFFYSIIIALIDSTLNDWGLQVTFSERSGLVLTGEEYMEIDPKGTHNFNKSEYHEQIRKRNPFTALEVLERLTGSRKATILLQSVFLNMPEKFNCLLERLQFLESPELASSELKLANQILTKIFANIRGVSHSVYFQSKHQLVGMLVDVGSCKTLLRCNYRSCQSPCWVPFDIYMENAMDSKQIPTKSAIDVLTEGIKTLQKFNQASWQETFLALWLSALRLVQRERDPPEGPIPHLGARLSVLLSIVPLAIANVLMDDSESERNPSPVQVSMESKYRHEMKSDGSRRLGLISSVEILGHFSCLLCPPALVVDAANQAARKAASFIYSSKSGTDIHANANTKEGGNLRHLIVEACIARNLMDTSVYFWPGYVSTSVTFSSDSSLLEKSPWLTFMEGTPLNNSLINSLTVTPASSLEEIEKLYYIALNGSEVERPAAAKILCGATLSSGWDIQEYVVHYVVKLLAYPVPHSGSWSLLVDNMSMLSAVLLGVSSVDTVHILSLHGVVPTVAASLLPLCEAFGSIKPTSNSIGDEPSVSPYMAFSLAFLFLIRLWKFCRPPLDRCIAEGGDAVDGLEYLLSLHNNHIMSSQDKLKSNQILFESESVKPVCIDSFPKLWAWCCQHKSCVASALSGLSPGNSVHQVANMILSMIFHKMTKGGISSTNSSSPTSNNASSFLINAGEDAFQRPMLPAWELMEALPFVLEAILTACGHGRLSSRDLTTGLRDLVDFLPASLAAIIDYFSSEVTRGVWKLVPMNGTDWPSPAAVLQSVESEIKAVLTSVGVEVPNGSSGGSPAMLPLPMAALVSLSITFKLDKSLEYIHAVTGAALENCALGCPWPSMPIIGSLWAQKVRRWHNFIVVSCSRSVFRHNKESVAQLLRSCFTSFLGVLCVSKAKLTADCSVSGLLGSNITAPGVYPYMPPGFLFLRSCRNIHNVQCLNDVVVDLVTEYSNELAGRRASAESRHLKSSAASLSLAARSAKELAMLGAALLCAAGGVLLVQELYKETIPAWLLSIRNVKPNNDSVVSYILEGYAMAYLLILSGSFIWGVGAKLPSSGTFSRRNLTIGVHLDFLADVMERKISLSCNPITWKTYVSCLVGLLISHAPAWLQEVKVDTLRKLAHGLCRYHEYELAFSLLQRGGPAAMGALAELVSVIECLKT